MRIAIIIVGIIGLLTLAFKWETISPDQNCTPKEGYIVPEGSEHLKKCPNCIHASDVTLDGTNAKRTCKKKMSLTGAY